MSSAFGLAVGYGYNPKAAYEDWCNQLKIAWS
jgi:hypothetical protein